MCEGLPQVMLNFRAAVIWSVSISSMTFFHMADHGSVQILGVGSLGINHLFQNSIQCLHPRSFTMEDKVFQKSENMYKLQLNKYIFHKLW